MLLSHNKLPIDPEAGQANLICKTEMLYYLVMGGCRWVSLRAYLQFSEIASHWGVCCNPPCCPSAGV